MKETYAGVPCLDFIGVLFLDLSSVERKEKNILAVSIDTLT